MNQHSSFTESYSKMYNVCIILLIAISCLHKKVYSQSHCPVHCSTCQPNLISCTNGGLQSLPVQLQPGTEKIILSGQLQFHGVLSYSNFTDLAPPKYNILNLTIRSSSIQELRTKTFSQLIHLKHLDLSENQRLTILSSSFDGLKLIYLKLDDIGKLILSKGCFIGLTAEYLSMKNSRLQTLNYDIFVPISTSLRHLFIENNQIRTLDQRFEPLFHRLDTVNLKDNPLICYCPLLWLSKTLRLKMISHKYQNTLQDAQLDSNNFPKCVAPSYLRNRQLQSIQEAEFNCEVPRISQIQIDLLSLNNGEMSCKVQSEEKGHKMLNKIYWQESSSHAQIYPQFNEKRSQISNDRMFSEEVDTRDSSAMVKIGSSNTVRQRDFQCIVENTAGRSTMAVRISWPTITNVTKGLPTNNDSRRITHSDISIDHHNLNNITPESYLFTKHYTLLEMTVAIIGTFIITVLIFMLFYRFFFHRKNGYKSGKQTLKYSLNGDSPNCNKGSLMAFHSPRSGYTIYETSMHYSDNSQTYDSIPHNSVYPHQQQEQPLFSTVSNSPSVHFIDYKTHKNLYPSSPCG